MKRLFTLCLLFPAALFAQPQGRYTIDMAAIAVQARSDSCYGALLDRFRAGDSLLTSDDLRTIYYGFAARNAYRGDLNPALFRVNELLEEGREREALELALLAQHKYPVSLRLLSRIVELGGNRLSEEIVDTYRRMYRTLMQTIRGSGDGSRQHPFRVIAVADEYDFLLRYLGTQGILRQNQLRTGAGPVLDRIDFEPVRNGLYDGGCAYFDITLPDDYLYKRLSE